MVVYERITFLHILQEVRGIGKTCNQLITLVAGTYTLMTINNGTTPDTNGLPVITSTLTIMGAGAATTSIERAASAPAFRLLNVAATGSLTLEGLTLRGGAVSRVGNIGGEGGGIFTDGTVTLTNCTLTENTAVLGGGIHNTGNGTVTITNCTLAYNMTPSGSGGGIFNNGTMTLTNSTLTENTADVLRWRHPQQRYHESHQQYPH